MTFESICLLKLAMSWSHHRTCGYFVAVAGVTRLPPPRSDDCRSVTAYSPVSASQLTFISGSRSSICHLERRSVAGSSTPTDNEVVTLTFFGFVLFRMRRSVIRLFYFQFAIVHSFVHIEKVLH